MPYFATALIALIVSTASFVGYVKYVPLSWLDTTRHVLGTSITTINGSDTISGSRTTINNNFAALNAGKIENSTTSVASITTLANLSTVGTITSGTWNGTTIDAAHGGTGSTTLSANQVLLGNGTSLMKTVNGWGTSGQSLVSNGAGVAPSWQSVSFDTTLSYSNTGTWSFAGAATDIKNLNASSTIIIGGQTYIFAAPAASSTFLATDASGNLHWLPPTGRQYTFASTTNPIVGNNAYATTSTSYLNIPANTLSASSTIRASGQASCQDVSTGGKTCTVYLRTSTGATLAQETLNTSTAATTDYAFSFTVTGANSATSQLYTGFTVPLDNFNSSINGSGSGGTASVDLTQATSLVIVIQGNSSSAVGTLNNYSIVVTP